MTPRVERQRKIKVAFITNIPTPYRQRQWEHFARLKDINITVYYCAHIKKGRFWNINPARGVKEIFLRGITFRNLHFNPDIFSIILKKAYLFFVGGYGYPTVMVVILLLKLLKKPCYHDLVTDGKTGILVPPKQPEAIAKAILYLLNHPQEAKEMGFNGRKRAVDYFGVERCAQKHENYILLV